MSAPPRPPGARDPGDGPEVLRGAIEAELAAEFPQLALLHCDAPLPAARRSPPGVREQLAMLSNRHRGATALALRREPVTAAYRIFYRHIGLDPDVTRTPVEAAVLERLVHGGFASHGLLADALLLALVQTSVPVWALDARRREGALQIRRAREGERLGRGAGAPPVAAGRLVVADATAPLAVLFGTGARECDADRDTDAVTLFSVRVAGVPAIHVDEALWIVTSTLAAR